MRSSPVLIVLVCILPIALSLNICNGCQNTTNCNYMCYDQQCQAYALIAPCTASSCITGYYPSYSSETNNVSRCVACNYTFSGCVVCNSGGCSQCQPEYLNQGGTCYTQGGYPVGYVPPFEQIWIAFVVIFSVLGTVFAVISFLKYRAMQAGK